jgi:hypothetical protein
MDSAAAQQPYLSTITLEPLQDELATMAFDRGQAQKRVALESKLSAHAGNVFLADVQKAF